MTSPRIVIIGSGTGGLTCAMALKAKFGHDNFTIFEKAGDVGGTWRVNVYPGCSSDVSMPFYCLSTELRNWTASHLPQEDILDYWVQLTKKHNLYPHIVFNHLVVSATWNESTHMYDVVTENLLTHVKTQSTAHIVISAVGILETPRYPDIPGLKNFKGDLFHSARWDLSKSLSGKRVGVVGNGASATQFVPIISEDPKTKVVQFCRSRNWIMPSLKKPYSAFRQGLFRTFPFLMRLSRWSHFFVFETLYTFVFANSTLRWCTTQFCKKYMLSSTPKEYHQKIIPTYPMGCKRVIFDAGYLSALHRPNLDLNNDGIETIVPDGIITKTGEHIPLDVLIFSTGYVSDSYAIPIKGSSNKTIQQYYEEHNGPTAYLGTCVPGFPNFFLIFGPNITTGHTSVVWTNELQVNYIMQLIAPVLSNKIVTIEVDEKATEDYDQMIQAKLSKSVFTQCHSWYRVGGTGKITNAFPEPASMFYVWFRKPNWSHFSGIGASAWLKQRRFYQHLRWIRSAVLFGLVAFGIYGYYSTILSGRVSRLPTLNEYVDWTKNLISVHFVQA